MKLTTQMDSPTTQIKQSSKRNDILSDNILEIGLGQDRVRARFRVRVTERVGVTARAGICYLELGWAFTRWNEIFCIL